MPNGDGVNRCNSDHHAEVKRNATGSSDTVGRGGGRGGDTIGASTSGPSTPVRWRQLPCPTESASFRAVAADVRERCCADGVADGLLAEINDVQSAIGKGGGGGSGGGGGGGGSSSSSKLHQSLVYFSF